MRRFLTAALLLLAVSCSNDKPQDQTVTVFAAASLQKAFTAEAAAFEKEHDGVKVVLSFAGSQALVQQIQQGAPADVVATADVETMAPISSMLKAPATVFAHNQLAIVTEKGNPLHLRALADLARPSVKVVLAGPTVPVGKAADKALAKAGVVVRPVSREDSVTGVVGKVRLGEADAGIAYATDLVGSGVDGTPLAGTTTSLAIGALDGGAAAQFLAFVTSARGHEILASFGFQ